MSNVVRIAKNHNAADPVYLVSDDQDTLHHQIHVDENCEVTLIEEYQANNIDVREVVTEIHAAKNSRIHYYKIQNENVNTTHSAKLIVHQLQDSTVNSFVIDKGGKNVQQEIKIHLTESGASCNLNGLYLLDQDNQTVINTIFVDHAAAHSASSMMYKGILDKKSQAAFTGKVYVHQNAQQINAHQANHNLLLSKDAQVSSKPELEIYADDIKCTHGATVGQLDQDALFYLRSRGVEQKMAEQMLMRAFAAEMLQQITQPSIKQYVQQQVGYHDEL